MFATERYPQGLSTTYGVKALRIADRESGHSLNYPFRNKMNKLYAVLVAVMFGMGSVTVFAADTMSKDAAKAEVKADAKADAKADKAKAAADTKAEKATAAADAKADKAKAAADAKAAKAEKAKAAKEKAKAAADTKK